MWCRKCGARIQPMKKRVCDRCKTSVVDNMKEGFKRMMKDKRGGAFTHGKGNDNIKAEDIIHIFLAPLYVFLLLLAFALPFMLWAWWAW